MSTFLLLLPFLLLLLLLPTLPLAHSSSSSSGGGGADHAPTQDTRIDLTHNLMTLTPVALARQLYRLQYYLNGQHSRWENGRLQVMLALIERHRAVPHRREPLQRLQQKLRQHTRDMRTFVRGMLAADYSDESELSASSPDQLLYQIEMDWEFHSYMTRDESAEWRRLVRRYEKAERWDSVKRLRLNETLALVRRIEGIRRVMRRFEGPDYRALSETMVMVSLKRIEQLSGNSDLLLALAPYRKSKEPAALDSLRFLWLKERAAVKALY